MVDSLRGKESILREFNGYFGYAKRPLEKRFFSRADGQSSVVELGALARIICDRARYYSAIICHILGHALGRKFDVRRNSVFVEQFYIGQNTTLDEHN